MPNSGFASQNSNSKRTVCIVQFSPTQVFSSGSFLYIFIHVISPHGRRYCELAITIGHCSRALSCAICDATPNSTHFGSTKINTHKFYLVGPDFAIRKNLNPRRFLTLWYQTTAHYWRHSLSGLVPHVSYNYSTFALS